VEEGTGYFRIPLGNLGHATIHLLEDQVGSEDGIRQPLWLASRIDAHGAIVERVPYPDGPEDFPSVCPIPVLANHPELQQFVEGDLR
jgi:hypothetical protein